MNESKLNNAVNLLIKLKEIADRDCVCADMGSIICYVCMARDELDEMEERLEDFVEMLERTQDKKDENE